jgi:RNA polymerase sigma-70 factor (ECF subfamily)
MKLDDAFFRRESARLLATLTRVFGVQNLALAEDVVQETLARAFEAWSHTGIPTHYAALLTTTAKNRAIDVLRRQRTARTFAPALQRAFESEWTLRPTIEEVFLPEALRDNELRMMFTCCQPRLRADVQVALILNVLCALSIDEIAAAFFASPSAIEKRLVRGKTALRESKRFFDLADADLRPRLATVQHALYLLFNEGYHGASPSSPIRVDLCAEALRLVRLLVGNDSLATPSAHALAATMCLSAARLPGRVDASGRLRALFEQDRSRWDAELISEGLDHLERSAFGNAVGAYHVEAGIAAIHATASSAAETDWPAIVSMYETLMKITPTPVVALNLAMALAQARGPEAGLEAISRIEDARRLARYPFYEAALGELEMQVGRMEVARTHFLAAWNVARSDAERVFLAERARLCSAERGVAEASS